jgi:hypothetical protein
MTRATSRPVRSPTACLTLFDVKQPENVRAAPHLRATQRFRPLAGTFRIGLRWAGDAAHTFDLLRSTELAAWEAVLGVPGVTF